MRRSSFDRIEYIIIRVVTVLLLIITVARVLKHELLSLLP